MDNNHEIHEDIKEDVHELHEDLSHDLHDLKEDVGRELIVVEEDVEEEFEPECSALPALILGAAAATGAIFGGSKLVRWIKDRRAAKHVDLTLEDPKAPTTPEVIEVVTVEDETE